MLDFFFMSKHESRNTECRFADIGQLDSATVAQEQLGTVAFLELLHLAGQRRLRDIQHFRGAGKAAVRGNRVKRAQVGVRYRHNLSEALVISI
jgi:hypothetical protein